MNFFYLSLLFTFPLLSYGLGVITGLSNLQLIRVNRILMNPSIDCRSKILIESVLYKKYERWAITIGSNFKKKHYYKCKHIPYYEISIYSRKGLLNAIKHYHPTKESSMFHLFAIHHIRGELYHGMTDLCPITNASKKQLLRKGTVYQRAGHNDDMMNHKTPSQNISENNPKKLWEFIEETSDPFTRRCIVYKFDYDFNKIRSNLEVSRLMECSEETVRKAILKYFVDNHLGVVLVREPTVPLRPLP